MDILLDVGEIIADFILTIFSGDDWKKLNKYIKKPRD